MEERPTIPETAPTTLDEGAETILVRGTEAARVKGILGQGVARDLPTDRYQAASLLGKGGMGEVYAAVDRVLGREVAIKVALRPEHPEILVRFLSEARVTAGLSHPGIVRLHDFGLDARGRPVPENRGESVRRGPTKRPPLG